MTTQSKTTPVKSESALAVIKTIAPDEFFVDQEQIKSLLLKVREEALAEVPDVSTEAGRKRIYTRSREVASARIALDNAGKDSVAAKKAELKLYDGGRKLFRDGMEQIGTEIMEPRTEWEEAEALRQQSIRSSIDLLKDAGSRVCSTSEQVKTAIESLKNSLVERNDFEEFYDEAIQTRLASLQLLTEQLQALEAQEKQAAENLRIAEENRKLKEEAEAKAKEQAEKDRLHQQQESERIAAQQKQERELAEKQALLDQQIADFKAKQEALVDQADAEAHEPAIEEEESPISSGVADTTPEPVATPKPVSEKTRSEVVRGEAAAALFRCGVFDGFGEELRKKRAWSLINMVEEGLIPHMELNYDLQQNNDNA